MKRTFVDYIEDIIESINLINDFTKDLTYEEFFRDIKTSYAVIRAIEIVGEAVKNIPDSVKADYPNIPWHKMAGMRNKIAHEYFGISMKIVWKVAKEELPNIKPDIEFLFKQYENQQ